MISVHLYELTTCFYQLISELDITGGDEKKVGYYAGLIVSGSFPPQWT